jgi:hypothetical protein
LVCIPFSVYILSYLKNLSRKNKWTFPIFFYFEPSTGFRWIAWISSKYIEFFIKYAIVFISHAEEWIDGKNRRGIESRGDL